MGGRDDREAIVDHCESFSSEKITFFWQGGAGKGSAHACRSVLRCCRWRGWLPNCSESRPNWCPHFCARASRPAADFSIVMTSRTCITPCLVWKGCRHCQWTRPAFQTFGPGWRPSVAVRGRTLCTYAVWPAAGRMRASLISLKSRGCSWRHALRPFVAPMAAIIRRQAVQRAVPMAVCWRGAPTRIWEACPRSLGGW